MTSASLKGRRLQEPMHWPLQETPAVFSESNKGKRDAYWRTGVHGPLQRKMKALLDIDSHLENGLLKSGNWGPSILSIKAVKITSISWIEEGGLSLPPSWYFSLTCKNWWSFTLCIELFSFGITAGTQCAK